MVPYVVGAVVAVTVWQISQIQTSLCEVVGPGLVSTSPAFMRSIVSHPVGPHGWLAKQTVIGTPLLGAGRVDTIFTELARPL